MTTTATRLDELEQLAWKMLVRETKSTEGELGEQALALLEYFRSHGVPPIDGVQLDDETDVPMILASAVRLSRPVHFRCGQWAITAYGLERTDGSYYAEHERLFTQDWLKHIGEKTWANRDDLEAALTFARDNRDRLWPK